MDPNHKRCDGTGWVCEVHTQKPFGHDGCPGPGVTCGCNPKGKVEWKEIYCSIDESEDSVR